MNQNICHFIPHQREYQTIHTIHFVLETRPENFSIWTTEAVYKMYYVREGKGLLHAAGKVQPLEAGDMFFTFPAVPFMIEDVEGLAYMYISFLGARGNRIMEKLKIGKQQYWYPECQEVEALWEQGINMRSEYAELLSESILLYSFSFLGNRQLALENNPLKPFELADRLKKYVDDHFGEQDFSLEQISNALSYNQKYISSVFKKEMGVGITEYLNTIRIQHACTMFQQGFTSVNDVSGCCGFSDPQYFSRVFKQRMRITPGNYIKNYKAETKFVN